jgi:maleate isomerase
MPDGSASRARIGILTPHLDAVPESEIQALAPAGVSIHSARVPLGMVGPDGEIIPYVDAEIAKAFAAPPAVDEAASLLSAVDPKAIVYAFTSSSYILGPDEDERLRDRLQSRAKNIPVIIQSAALVTALQTLQMERISLIHPPWFSDELDALGVSYFQSQGIEVLEHGQAKLTEDYSDISLDAIIEWVVSHTPDDADAAVIGGGGFRATGAIAAIEGSLGRPVLSANQAAFWLALRVSGIDDQLDGYGLIFEKRLAT